MLELSDAQYKAQEEQSTAYYLVQNSRKEIDQYIAKISELQKEVNNLDDDDSDDDESDESSVGEEDSQTINEGGVFSSTQNDAAEVTPEKNGAAKKKKKNKSTPRRRKNASRFPTNDLGPLDSSLNKVSPVGVAAGSAPEKDAAPPRDNTTKKRRAAPPAPAAAAPSNVQPDFASFIRAMELDQTK